MKTFTEVYAELRRGNRKQYALLAGCCFFSVLLITAYSCMMRAPTILSILPEGGDSRKQVMMIFVLAVIGCGVFTAYASGLFFRHKSREIGIFMALGASRRQIRGQLQKELSLISVATCAVGTILGAPLAWLVWQIFRLMVVDTEEMVLRFDPQAYLFSLAFSIFVIVMLYFMGSRFIRRTNIVDIVQESHKSEPIKDVPRWYGVVGIVLLLAGGFLGYMAPSFFILGLRWYPPEGLMSIFYLPALVGLYMILLQTVVNGWGGKKKQYKDLISTSMMKFQGRQTVRNMLVMTLLIAGAYFASFYTPMMGTGAMLGYDLRPVDYVYSWRDDQNVPGEAEVLAMAEGYGVTVTDITQVPMIRLAVDGYRNVEEETPVGIVWHEEYRETLASDLFFSESSYTSLTGETLGLQPGQVAAVMDSDGSGKYRFAGNASVITNFLTGQKQTVECQEIVKNEALFGHYVMNDADYAAMSEGLTSEWTEQFVAFNVENCADTYDFAKALFYRIVDSSDEKVAVLEHWDPVQRAEKIETEGIYMYDRENSAERGIELIDYDQRDSSGFRLFWKYMPAFRVLDKADFVKTMAVYLTLFIFITVICFAAVIVIAFTRCMTIALTNAQVYDDLRHLGAPNAYLYNSVRGQVKRVFLVPIIVGTTLIYCFYMMIMYFNGDPAGITSGEFAGLVTCFGVIVAVSALLYGVYRITLKRVCAALQLKPSK